MTMERTVPPNDMGAVQTGTWKETKQRMKTLEDLFDQTKMFRKFI